MTGNGSASGRILVTGGAGFIGSHITDALVSAGREVVVIDDLSTGRRENLSRQADLRLLDIASGDTPRAVADIRPAVVIHCAGQVSVAASFRAPEADARTNVVGSLNVIQGAMLAGSSRFVYVTTGGALYGRPVRLPCREEDPVEPLSPYGLTKFHVEGQLAIIGGALPSVALRLANVYGPRQSGDGEAGVVAKFALAMARAEPVTIDGDGEQTRDFVYVADVVAATLRAMATDTVGPVNIGSGIPTSINRLFRVLAQVSGYTRAPSHGPQRKGDIRDSLLATEYAATAFGWRAQTSLEAGLRQTFNALLAAG